MAPCYIMAVVDREEKSHIPKPEVPRYKVVHALMLRVAQASTSTLSETPTTVPLGPFDHPTSTTTLHRHQTKRNPSR